MEVAVTSPESVTMHFNPIALKKAKIVCNFGLSECNRLKLHCCVLRYYLHLSIFSGRFFLFCIVVFDE